MLAVATVHGQPGGQHIAVGGPQLLQEPAEAGIGAAMVVMSGKAITMTRPSLIASSRLEMRGLISRDAGREIRSNSNLRFRNWARASQTTFASTVSCSSLPTRIAISSTVVCPSQSFQTIAAVWFRQWASSRSRS